MRVHKLFGARRLGRAGAAVAHAAVVLEAEAVEVVAGCVSRVGVLLQELFLIDPAADGEA